MMPMCILGFANGHTSFIEGGGGGGGETYFYELLMGTLLFLRKINLSLLFLRKINWRQL